MSGPDTVIAGRYRLVSQIASGGMGIVWQAWDELLQRPVALKQLRPQPGLSADEAELTNRRAMREARITARLHHAHAVPVYDVVEYDGQPCLIMQYLPSTSLQSVVNGQGPLPPAEAARIGAEIASALAAAHAADIVHRDVKPGNVLIADDGSAKITDFGISHALGDTTLTSTGMVTGTPAYLAPEVARGAESSFASDVFSLGATLYAATEGTPPFGTDQNPMAVLHKVASGQVLPPHRSGPLTPLLLRMLAPDPAARPAMLDVAHTLTALHADAAAGASAPTRQMGSAPSEAGGTTERMAPAGAALLGAAALPGTAALPVQAASGNPPPTVRPPASPGRPPGNPDRGPNTRLIALAVAVLLIGAVVLGIVLLSGQGNNRTGNQPSAGSTGSNRASSTPPSSTPATSASQPSSSAATSASTSQPATSSSAPTAATPTAGQLAQAIKDYYKLLPGNTDAGWSRLTQQYQNDHAGGRPAYQSFWDGIKRVSAGKTSGSPPGTAEAVITYVFKDGHTVIEDTSFGLVPENGILKINTSNVLSSRSG